MKKRLDVLMFEKGLVSSREKAKALIMAGSVFVNNEKAYKPGETVNEDAAIRIKEELPFVSRGGLKLDKGIKVFNINLKDKICIDVGASTGGFTDCMLINGAKKVYSVDVGYGQLDWKLRQNEKVVVLERTNARYLSEKEIPEPVDFISADVAFISLNTALSTAFSFLKDDGEAMVLIKPQFEAGREFVGKKGVVRDEKVHRDVIVKVCTQMKEKGMKILGIDFSPIKGPEGNIEYLLYMKKQGESLDYKTLSDEIAAKSHELLS